MLGRKKSASKRKKIRGGAPDVVATTATRDNQIRRQQAKVDGISRMLYRRFSKK